MQQKLFKIKVNLQRKPEGRLRYKPAIYTILVVAFEYKDALEAARESFREALEKHPELYIKSMFGAEIKYDNFLNITQNQNETTRPEIS
jgi:hypothetical protein